MNTSSRILVVALLAAVLTASVAAGHSIILPQAVQADAAGHFTYDVIITISEPVEFGSEHMDGSDNTDIGVWWADGFCMSVINPGTFTTTIEGNLTDPAASGSVYYEFYVCDGWLGAGTTTILSLPVGTEATSWSAVKGLYR